MNKIYEGMLELSEELSKKGIVHELDVNRVGLDKRYNLKYYLGVDFKIDRIADKDKLMEKYRMSAAGFVRDNVEEDLESRTQEDTKDKDEPVTAEL